MNRLDRRRGFAPDEGFPLVEVPGEGFTLVELVLVLAILAASALLVLPVVGRGSESLRLRAEGGRVAALLREARREAVTRRVPARVSLDGATGVSLTLLPSALSGSSGGTGDTGARRLALAEGFQLSSSRGGDSVTFSPRGIGRDVEWILESRAGRRLAIDVEAVTARVTVAPEGGT